MAEYADMADDEYASLGEELTRTVPKLGPNGSGFLGRREMRLWGLTNMSVNFLIAKATADCKSPAKIIDELIHKEMVSANQSALA